MVDKEYLCDPEWDQLVERRNKKKTVTEMEKMAQMSAVERKAHQTETGTLYKPDNLLFSEEIFLDPHKQVARLVIFFSNCSDVKKQHFPQFLGKFLWYFGGQGDGAYFL